MVVPLVAIMGGLTVNPSCCDSDKTLPPSRLSREIEILGRVALTLFAFLLAPLFMLIAYSIGVLCGLSYALIQDRRRKVQYKSEILKPVCAQGYLERLSGKKWPIPVTQVVTDFFIGLHTYHDPKIFGPVFCGLFTGFWTGRFAINILLCLSHRAWKKEPPSAPKKSCCSNKTLPKLV